MQLSAWNIYSRLNGLGKAATTQSKEWPAFGLETEISLEPSNVARLCYTFKLADNDNVAFLNVRRKIILFQNRPNGIWSCDNLLIHDENNSWLLYLLHAAYNIPQSVQTHFQVEKSTGCECQLLVNKTELLERQSMVLQTLSPSSRSLHNCPNNVYQHQV